MTVTPAAFADAAASLLGTPYRLHGADRFGVDCLGLVFLALREAGGPRLVAAGYGLRNGSIDRFLPLAEAGGFEPASGEAQDGDVRLMRTGPAQYHCAVLHGDSMIHAHAGLRYVVRQPVPAGWPILAAYRLKGNP